MFKRAWLVLPVLAVLCLAGLGLPLDAQPAPKGAEQIAKTIDDWSKRQKRFQSVRYVLMGEIEEKALPAKSNLSAKRPIKYVVLLDLLGGRIRIENDGSGVSYQLDKYTPLVTVSAYDRTTFQTNVDRAKSGLDAKIANVGISKGSLATIQIDADIWPILFAHGIVPTINKPSRPDRLLAGHTADEFEYRNEVFHEENRCFVLRTDPVATTPFLVDELFIDPGKESAINRYVNFAGKSPWIRLDVTYEEREGTWLPRNWIFANSVGSKLVRATTMRVESLEVNPVVSDDDFTLPIPPGSIVVTSTYPEAGKGLDPFKPANELSQVDERGKRTTLEETGFTTGEGVQLPPEPLIPRWLWVLAASVGFVGLLCAVVLYRRRIRRTTTS